MLYSTPVGVWLCMKCMIIILWGRLPQVCQSNLHILREKRQYFSFINNNFLKRGEKRNQYRDIKSIHSSVLPNFTNLNTKSNILYKNTWFLPDYVVHSLHRGLTVKALQNRRHQDKVRKCFSRKMFLEIDKSIIIKKIGKIINVLIHDYTKNWQL